MKHFKSTCLYLVDLIKSKFPNVPEAAWSQLECWATLLREWNKKVNLISRKDIEHLEQRHLAHCLEITNHLKLMAGERVDRKSVV